MGELFTTPVLIVLISFAAGLFAAVGGIWKVYALRYIDTTIYFPLLKLASPILAIIFGVVFFSEAFSLYEWIGLLMGLLVPLLLITKAENQRQNNLLMGLMLVALTAVISAGTAAMYKYSIDITQHVWAVHGILSFGVFVGSCISLVFKKGRKTIESIQTETNLTFVVWAGIRGLLIATSTVLLLFAFKTGGTLAVVHTIHSLYILVPIVLAIVFYKEHWNWQKVIAIVLSVVALGLLG